LLVVDEKVGDLITSLSTSDAEARRPETALNATNIIEEEKMTNQQSTEFKRSFVLVVISIIIV
jgi:hypothetical protein